MTMFQSFKYSVSTFALVTGVAVWALASVANAQDTRGLNQRLNSLENEVQTLNRAVYKGEVNVGSLQGSADTQAQFQEYDSKLRGVQGRLEEADHRMAMIEKKTQGQYEDLSGQLRDAHDKIRELEARMTAQALKVSNEQTRVAEPRKAVDAPMSVMNKVSDQVVATVDEKQDVAMKVAQAELENPRDKVAQSVLAGDSKALALAEYEQAFGMLKQGKYNSAQLHFETFLKNNPDHSLASNAKYWLGETYYARGDFSQAARVFAEGFQSYPTGSKAPDNLLKLGLTLESLGKKDDACIALKQVKKEFSDSAGSVINRADKEISRLGCQ